MIKLGPEKLIQSSGVSNIGLCTVNINEESGKMSRLQYAVSQGFVSIDYDVIVISIKSSDTYTIINIEVNMELCGRYT